MAFSEEFSRFTAIVFEEPQKETRLFVRREELVVDPRELRLKGADDLLDRCFCFCVNDASDFDERMKLWNRVDVLLQPIFCELVVVEVLTVVGFPFAAEIADIADFGS